MKKYSKPSIKYVELRVEESLAGNGSILNTTILSNDTSKVEPQITFDNMVSFWMKYLRK